MFEFYRDKLVAVTGGTGLNRSYIVKALVEAGARVRAISHSRPPNEFTRLASEIVSADLADARQAAEAVRGAEIVMHAWNRYSESGEDAWVRPCEGRGETRCGHR